MISKLDLMKLFSQYEGEISMSDFTPEELEEYLREAEGADAPLSPAEWKARINTLGGGAGGVAGAAVGPRAGRPAPWGGGGPARPPPPPAPICRNAVIVCLL